MQQRLSDVQLLKLQLLRGSGRMPWQQMGSLLLRMHWHPKTAFSWLC
jgi:hypothetical protein